MKSLLLIFVFIGIFVFTLFYLTLNPNETIAKFIVKNNYEYFIGKKK